MDANTVIAVCAVVIAMCSLGVSFVEHRLVRQHSRYSVRPILQMRRNSKYYDTQAGLKILNCGLGPAVITGSLVALDGNLIGQWDLATYREICRTLPEHPRVMTVQPGTVLEVGHANYLLSLDDFEDKENAWFW